MSDGMSLTRVITETLVVCRINAQFNNDDVHHKKNMKRCIVDPESADHKEKIVSQIIQYKNKQV